MVLTVQKCVVLPFHIFRYLVLFLSLFLSTVASVQILIITLRYEQFKSERQMSRQSYECWCKCHIERPAYLPLQYKLYAIFRQSDWLKIFE